MRNHTNIRFIDYLVSDSLDEKTSHQLNHARIDSDTTTILGKFQVDNFMLESVKQRLQDIRPHLLDDAFFTADELLGLPYLVSLSEIGQQLALLALMHFASEGFLSLKMTDYTLAEPPLFYFD